MKSVILICFLGVATVVIARPKTPFDNINIEEIFENRRLLLGYINCILERGNCTRAGKDLKSSLKNVLEENCDKCSEDQRKSIIKVINYLVSSEPESWNQLKSKVEDTRGFPRGRGNYEEQLSRL
ncbi:chemosensory protein 2 isoform X2 [Bombyx mori]|uniref:chemosensory protein 2 isoform X2 n=1 Tax=Bombyx mori TaxID=7091 RepID=UPI002ED0D81D